MNIKMPHFHSSIAIILWKLSDLGDLSRDIHFIREHKLWIITSWICDEMGEKEWEDFGSQWEYVARTFDGTFADICHPISNTQSWELWNFNPPKSSHVSLFVSAVPAATSLANMTTEKVSFHQNTQLNVLNQQSAWGYVICAMNRKKQGK